MYFAYFDESGDSGFNNSPTDTFTLACVLIHDSEWLNALDQSISFRRYLRKNFKIPARLELKATGLVHNKGDFRNLGLSFKARMEAYKAAMRFQRKAKVFTVFSVCIVKSRIKNKATTDVREVAWRYAIQRLERFGRSRKDNIHVVPDDGHGDFIRKKIREMRRYSRVPSAYGESTLNRSAENIIEDPSERNSKHSFFVQLADLNAYAAFRRAFPGNNFDGAIWDSLGECRIADVNKISGGPPGVVIWPEKI